MTTKIKHTVIEIPLWERNITIMIGGNYIDIGKYAKENKFSIPVVEEINKDKLTRKGSQGGAYFCMESGEGILWFPRKRISAEILSHEATHIVDWLMAFIGSEGEMEARAYTVGWLVKTIPSVIKKSFHKQ